MIIIDCYWLLLIIIDIIDIIVYIHMMVCIYV